MNREQIRKEKVIRKELLRIEKEESKLAQNATKAKPAGWKQELENRIPEKVYAGLEAAFAKGSLKRLTAGRTWKQSMPSGTLPFNEKAGKKNCAGL